MNRFAITVCIGLHTAIGGCPATFTLQTGGEGAQCIGSYGETNVVIVVNPVVNDGTAADVSVGSELEGVLVWRGDEAPDPNDPNAPRTDATGLVVVGDLPTGDVIVHIRDGSIVLTGVADGELLDVAVSYRGDASVELLTLIRYPSNLPEVVVQPGESISDASRDGNVVILLAPGVYEENVELRGNNVFVFGACSDDGIETIIRGDLSVAQGNTVRVRGLRVEGHFALSGNNVSAAFCELQSATVSGNCAILLRNTLPDGASVTVTSANALLLGNAGIP